MTAEEIAWVERGLTKLQERIDELEQKLQERVDEFDDKIRAVRNRVYQLEQG